MFESFSKSIKQNHNQFTWTWSRIIPNLCNWASTYLFWLTLLKIN